VVAPSTTYDPTCATGAKIPIEEREPGDASVWNPAFNLTPKALITSILFEDRTW